MNPIYELLYVRDSFQCRHCHSRSNLTPHHVIYRSSQGPDTLDNLLTLCMTCHEATHRHDLEITVIRKENNNLVVHFTRCNSWKPQ